MHVEFDLYAGESIDEVARKAKLMAESEDVTVGFDFNGVTCLVNKDTIPDCLVRYYLDAHIMDWRSIGPNYDFEYDVDTKIELYTRRLAQAKKLKENMAEWDRKDKEQKGKLEAAVGGIELNIISGKEDEYKTYIETNSRDGYSKAVIEYGEAWAKLMQIEMAKGKSIKEMADSTQEGLGFLGITGFQFGCVMKGLAHFWIHGEELRKWHNKNWGVPEDKQGVVNPAVFTIA